VAVADQGYAVILADIAELIDVGRKRAARSINVAMTATYWRIGRRIVDAEQRGAARAQYGEELIVKLSRDLIARAGRGFGPRNLEQMRRFFLTYPPLAEAIPQTLSAQSRARSPIPQTLSAESPNPSTSLEIPTSAGREFPLPWSHYVQLLAVKNDHARRFYEGEALRGGWTVRQLERQIDTQFYERAAMSKNKVAMLRKGEVARPGDAILPEERIRDPMVLEFLELKDEYSESELEEALIRDLEMFLLELGSDFTFVGRQRRLRIGDQWFRIDLLFFHRRLRCLVVIDLKLGKLTHADAGQMHLYVNYARKHWTIDGENPPVGLILCASKDAAFAEYALDDLPNTVMAAEYRTVLPSEKLLVEHLEQAREHLLTAQHTALARGVTVSGERSEQPGDDDCE
jgi:predicted nuclease of restriction endonuclease-like (RecB) superfamily